MATDHISWEVLRKLLEIPPDGDCDNCSCYGRFGCKFNNIRILCEANNDCTAADVRPVKHGEWIVHDYGDYQLIECDQCHAQMWNHQKEMPNYCHNCGCAMENEK